MGKNYIEKSLKRFIKKKVTYSLSLLVVFLITGIASLGNEISAVQEIKANRSNMASKLKTEKENMQKKLLENEEALKEYNNIIFELIQKGDYFSKPIYGSSQVFFSYQNLSSGKMKDRTDKEFAQTIAAVKEYNNSFGRDKVEAGNGTAVDTEVFRETIELGANMVPITPELPAVDINVDVNVEAPNVELGALPEVPNLKLPDIPDVDAPVVISPNAPGTITVKVTPPKPVDKIAVDIPQIKAPEAPTDKEVNVGAPATPEGFEPTTVTPPTPPTTPDVIVPEIPTFASNVISNGNGTNNHIDTSTLANGVIEMVAITDGDFNLKRDTGNTWTYSYSGYDGMNAWAVGNASTNNPSYSAVESGKTWSNWSRGETTSGGSQLGFQKLVGNTTQSTMLSNGTFLYSRAMESSTANLGEFVHLDMHGAASPTTQRAGLVNATNGLSNKQVILDAYDDAGDNINWNGRTTKDSNRYTWINSGKIVIEGGTTSLTNHYDHHNSTGAKAIVINTGDVIFQPYKVGNNIYDKYTSTFVMSLDGTAGHHIMYNGETGKIQTYTQTASMFLSGSSGAGRPLSIVNRGTLEMYGENSAGIYLKTASNNDLVFNSQDFKFDAGTNKVTAGSFKPIKLFGDKSIGLYGAATAGTTTGNLAVDIGETGKGNQNFTTSEKTNGDKLTDYNINSSGKSDNIEGSFGIVANGNINLTAHQIRIYDKTENSVAVYPASSNTINLGGGEILLSGGKNNIGIYTANKGMVNSTGEIKLENGTGNMAIYAKGNTSNTQGDVSVNKVTATNTTDSIVLYGAEGASVTVKDLNVTSKVGDTDKSDTGAAFATGNGTVITLNRDSAATSANIDITGKQVGNIYKGFGLLADKGGVINAKNNYIKVTNGSTAVASLGSGSNVDLTGGTVEFNGNGYAVYSDGAGKINLSDVDLILEGNSTAFDLDMKHSGNNPITLDENSRIKVNSDDVVVFNLKNATGLDTDKLENSIETALGTALGGVQLDDLVSGGTAQNYKIAAVDGGSITIGNLDKTGTGAVGETETQKNGNFYYNRFLGQRLVATTKSGSTITAILTDEQAKKYNNQVVGLEMNSSKLATSNQETGIKLVGSKIIADRNGTGAGGIGAFINYGVVDIDENSTIEVERDTTNGNTANDGAVGVYAVNGSEVNNKGTITVGGNNSIGILGMAYREDSDGKALVNEFGNGALNQGKIAITNAKTITLDGEGSIGIYAKNNNTSGTVTDVNVTNNGDITVGNSGTNTSIGIYGDKATITNDGTITTGTGGVGIYGINGSNIAKVGTLSLGENGIGVMLDGKSEIKDTSITLSSNGGTGERTGIFYKGTGNENQSISADINASNFTGGTAIYAKDMSVSLVGKKLTLGENGVGIFVSGNQNNVGKNDGTIELGALSGNDKKGSVGMFTGNAKIINNGSIDLKDKAHTGMFAQGTGIAENTGTINLDTDYLTGIFVKDGGTVNLNTQEDNDTKGIDIKGKLSLGVYADKGNVNINENVTFTSDNSKGNIYVYSKDSTVNLASDKTMKVDGVATSTDGKTVGIYLENAGTGNTFNGNSGKVEVANEAIGIYSRGNNTLNGLNLLAKGKDSIGAYLDGGATISGTVTTQGDTGTGELSGGIGIYGTGGAVTIADSGLTLKMDSGKGTGMYLTDGAYVTGGKITLNDTVSGINNIGIYYSKGTNDAVVTNGSEIEVTGTNSLAIYAADGINLENTADITSTGNNNIATYIGGNSTYTSKGNITLNGQNNIGIYAGSGVGINEGTIDLTSASAANGGSSVGMIVQAGANDIATVENSGTINSGSNLGMYIAGDGTNLGKNSGTIETSTGTGVYLHGSGNKFDGANGTIKVTGNGTGIYIKDNDEGSIINLGNLDIASGGVGVFAENGKIDFDVNTGNSNGEIGVVAKGGTGTTTISSNITTGNGSVGVYLLDDKVSLDGANIETGNNIDGTGAKTSVGVLLKAAGNYGLNNLSVNAKNGVGIYLQSEDVTNGSGQKNLTFDGTLTTGGVNSSGETGGIGIYVGSGNTLTTGDATINVTNKATGVYIAGGTANLGTEDGKTLTFNFDNGGIGIFNDKGTLNLGNNVVVNGSGTLAGTSNRSITSGAEINISEGATGILGAYEEDSTVTSPQSLVNDTAGIINATNGGIGIAAIQVKDKNAPGFDVKVENKGTINVSGKSSSGQQSIGIYTDVANVVNTGTINVGTDGIGIYSNYNKKLTSVQNDNMVMTGDNGIGVYLKGKTDDLTSNNITSNGGTGNTGLILDGVTDGSGNTIAINAGTISLGNESIGVYATTGTKATISGDITVGNSGDSKSAIGVASKDSDLIISSSANITTGDRGIGVYAEGGSIDVQDTSKIHVGTDGIYIYSNNSDLTFAGDIVADNQIGIYAKGGTINSSGATITAKNGGIGVYAKESAPSLTGTVKVESGTKVGDKIDYSIGIYYDNVTAGVTLPTVTQDGNYTIGTVLDKTTGTSSTGISIGTGKNNIGVMAKNGNVSVTGGGINVGAGDNNIGIYGENSAINVIGNISVGAPTSQDPNDPVKYSSIAAYLNKGSYIGRNGDMTLGNNSIGIYGKDVTGITQSGTDMTVGDSGVGIYGSGTGVIDVDMTTITLGNNNAIGVYAKGMNADVTGNINVGTDTSIGIVSEGNGNVKYSGNMTIADKVNTGSVGIYKTGGSGTIETSGTWTIGTSGYGIYAEGNNITINNSADMTLGMSGIGIYSKGNNTVSNSGDITVGQTNVNGDHNKLEDHENSVGMYLDGGSVGTNTGRITVNYDHSVGVYAQGKGTSFTNAITGIINVDNGGVGILVRDGAIAINDGTINLGGTLADCGATTVGMAGYGATIINNGTINVDEGVGMVVGVGTVFENNGTINVDNGIGISGVGELVNKGTIIVTGDGKIYEEGGTASSANIGAVEILPDGTIKINGNYTSIGGTFVTEGGIIVDGAYVDITTGMPVFDADSVNGEINILPNFALTGNGISYKIEDFVNAAMEAGGSKITPITSPLFVAKVDKDGNLIIAKRPYADITIGDQFDALDKGLDNILESTGGQGKDSEILKGLNAYLEGLKDTPEFEKQASQMLSEFRGDIYATIQERMQNINQAFSNSFYELEESYNLTKDSNKYSVIYTDGDYKDPTLGIDDYDYRVTGLLYMKEKEGTEYGSKYGYTLGFAVSEFEFDDGGSTEDVYSLRAGAHVGKVLSEEHDVSLLSRAEIGYNRHMSERKLNLQETFDNEAEYNTYTAKLENRFMKNLHKDFTKDLVAYGVLDFEYGRIDGFTEKEGSNGGLLLNVDDNDYFSTQIGVGLKGEYSLYTKDDIIVKAKVDGKYLYELGENYDGNRAQLKDGGQGYYNLITPEEKEGMLVGTVGIGIEKANQMGITFEVTGSDQSNREEADITYGIRFNYSF